MNEQQALEMLIKEMSVSDSFCKKSREMGFEKLSDIVFLLPEDLIAKKGFSYSWLGELSEYLDKNGLLYMLQPLPGKNHV